MPIASGSTAISKMYVGGTLVSAAYLGNTLLTGADAFSPLSLFAASEQGAWYDPSDWSTLFQDSAGTTPVTAVGQPVGKILDKSGRGNHASQATAINRPVLQIDGSGRYYLALNGTNSWMSTPAINFTATNKMTVVAGVRKLSDAAAGWLVNLNNNSGGSFRLTAPNAATGVFGALSRGTTEAGTTSVASPAPVTAVLTATYDIAAPSINLRINAADAGSSTATQGTGNFATAALTVGQRPGGTLLFNGQLYGVIIRGALSDATKISATENYINSKTGAY